MSKTSMITNHRFYWIMSCWAIIKKSTWSAMFPESQAVVCKNAGRSLLFLKSSETTFTKTEINYREIWICFSALFPISHTKLKASWLLSVFGAKEPTSLWGEMFPSQRKGRNGNKRVSLKTQRFPPANSETHPRKLSDIGMLPGTPKAMGSLLPGGGGATHGWGGYLG